MTIIDQSTRDKIQKDLDHTYLVEAGAGTGKTTLLVSRIMEILRRGKASLSQIVAITFTEKASAELKLRVQGQLEDDLARGDGATRSKLQQALSMIDRAPITTIHGFCATLLRDNAVEARIDPSFQVLDDSTRNMLYRKVWKKWVWSQIQKREPVLRDLLKAGVSLDNIAGLAEQMAMHRDALAGFAFEAQPVDVPALKNFVGATLKHLAGLAAGCRDRCDLGYRRISHLGTEWPSWEALTEEAFQMRLLRGFPAKPEGNQNNWDSPETMRAVKTLLKTLQEEIQKAQASVLHNLSHHTAQWLLQFLEFYRQEKRAQSYIDFEDLLIATRDLLKNDREMRGRLQKNYRYLLVDEFQDTDPLQVEIVFFLAEDGAGAETWDKVRIKPGKLFLVGDPKQSIYRFRRADIEIYEEVKRKLGGCVSITQNFRSCPGIIEWVNLVFSHLIQPPADGLYQPAYTALDAFREPFAPQSVIFLNTPRQDGKALKGDLARSEAYAIARGIRHIVGWPLGSSRPAAYGDVAILLRRFSHIEFLEEALQHCEVPYQVVGSKSYYQCLEVKSFLSLLRALLEPCDAMALVAALRSPIFAVSDEEILQHKFDHASLDYRKIGDRQSHIGETLVLLGELHLKIDTCPLPLLIEEILTRTGALFTFSEMPPGEQKAANLLKFLEMAHTLAKIGIADFRDFVHRLSDLERTEQDEAECYVHDEDADAVHIFSIHRAKGLEFPVVFLGDLAASPPNISDILLDRRLGDYAFKIRGGLGVQTGNYPQQAEAEKRKVEAEEKRLLYVAMTRARDYLVIPLAAAGHGYLKFFGPFLPQAPVKSPYFAIDIPEIPEMSLPYRAEKPPEICRDPDKNWAEARAQYLQHRGAVLENASTPSIPGLSAEALFSPDGERRKIEEVVRRVLLRLELPEEADLFFPCRVETLLHKESLSKLTPEETKRAQRMLMTALSSPLMARARRSDKVYRELPVVLSVEGIAVDGVIPLCFQEQGIFTAVAYASSPCASGHPLLGAFYALALRKITGCPVKEFLRLFLDTGAVDTTAIADPLLEEVEEYLKNAARALPAQKPV